ncbi:hypothetical protein V5O48_000449 [Marasmius crinis-equi]|uniref:GST N-terminal domain-containing protein n=1 Tax=Marasmius crinis-equi TaxID=585013 RepID=A0ABR3G2E8_9AGAR
MATHTVPKAVLYYDPKSIWCCVAQMTLIEKGYGQDELDLKVVDLAKGENYGPPFLRLNPKGTVPTLVVPLDKTLSDNIESRYKAITESKAIVEFLDKSRSPLSRTHTTSDAPAPSLAPATIAFSATCKIIVDDILHSDAADPNKLFFLNARDDSSLRALSEIQAPHFKGKHDALVHLLSEAENGKVTVSEKVKELWKTKKDAVDVLLNVYDNASKSYDELDSDSKVKRDEYFKMAKTAWDTNVPKLLTKLNEEVIGPFALGEQLSIADLHLGPWLAVVARLAGAAPSDDGDTAIGKLEKHIGNGFSVPRSTLAIDLMKVEGDRPGSRSKLAAFWDTMRERPSWKKVYADGLAWMRKD